MLEGADAPYLLLHGSKLGENMRVVEVMAPNLDELGSDVKASDER